MQQDFWLFPANVTNEGKLKSYNKTVISQKQVSQSQT
jgi:hypothetical protein